MADYSFACPAPCKREVKVSASNDLDAVEKIITAGAMSCRTIGDRRSCDQAPFDMPPMPEDELRHLVGMCLREG